MRLTCVVLAIALGGAGCDETDGGGETAAAKEASAGAPAIAELQAAATAAPVAVPVTVVNAAANPVNTKLVGTASVTGTVTLAGVSSVAIEGTPAVSAAISSLPPVSLAGTPTVVVAPRATVAALAETVVTVPVGETRQWFIQAAEYEEVRVAVRSPSLSNPLTFDAFSGAINLEHADLGAIEWFTRTYRVPGLVFGVMISNESGTEDETVRIAIYGR